MRENNGPVAKKPKKVKPKPPGPPKFATKIPVRPGALTNRSSSKPSTQAQRTHVHESKVGRNRQLKRAQAQHDVTTNKDLAVARRHNEAHPVKHKQTTRDLYLTDPKALKAAGFKKEGAADKIAKLPGRVIPTLAASGYQTAKATYEDPTKVIPKTVEGGAKMAASFAVAPVHYTMHPSDIKKLPGQVVKDTERRYKDVIKHPEKFRARIKKEGAASELVDIAAVASPVGGLAGRGAQTVARAGAFGKVVQKIATKRPEIQVTGGAAKAQELHPNLARNVARAGTDTVRRKVQQHRARKENAPLEVVEAQRKSAAGTPTVTHVSRYLAKKSQRVSVGGAKGARMARQKAETQRELKQGHKNIGSLDKHETRAFKYATQYGARDVESGVRVLTAHRERIVRERAKDPNLKLAKKDELKDIDAILAAPERHFTPKLAKVVDEEAQRSRRAAGVDPDISDTRAELRRAKPQAELHGVTRKQIDTEASAKEVKAARKEREAAQREYEDARAEHGTSRGRAAVLSRQVGGSKAERRSEARTVPVGAPARKVATPDTANFKPHTRPSKQPDGKGGHKTIHSSGRGWIDTKGKLHTWYEEDVSHAEYMKHRRHQHPDEVKGEGEAFMVRPDGTIRVHGGSGKMGDHEIVARAVSQDSRLKPPKDWDTSPNAKGPIDSTGKTHPNYHQELERAKAAGGERPAVPGGAQHAGGGRGVEVATERLQKAHARRAAADKKLADVTKAHKASVRDKKAGRTAESDQAFLARASAARGNLAEGEYFPSTKRSEGGFSAFTTGGTKASAGDKTYKGDLTRTGREASDPEIHLTGVAKNIKRKHNWNLVADNYEQHTVPWSRDKTLNELKDELDERGIDPKTVSFWNPEKFHGERNPEGDVDLDPEFASADVADAVGGATLRGEKAIKKDSEFANTKGWAIVPREVHDEIHSSVTAGASEGKVARSWDIAKGKASRAILANPAWAGFQVASNALMSSIAGAGPMSLVKGQRAFRKLPPERRDALEAMAGITPWHNEERHLGATAGQLAHGYHALRSLPILKYRPVHSIIDAFFRFDNAQNNFFRRAVFYNDVQRKVYKDMAANGGKAHALQGRIANTLKLPPDEQLQALLKDPALMEKHAQHVDDFLGNWTSYTAKERRILGRAVMFYGFLRFSTRLALYTMPVKHPITASIMLKLGDLEYQEQKRIFGGDPPTWEIGNFYGKDGKKQFDAKRLNPLFNAMGYLASTSEDPDKLAVNLASIAGMLPPAAQVTLNQIAGKNVAFQQNYTVNGKTEEKRKSGDIGWGDKLQIVASELLNSSAYYRALAKSGGLGVKPLRGKQSSDSSLLRPSPIQYSDKPQARKARERNAARIKSENRNSKNFGETLIEPFRPERRPETVARAKYYREQKAEGPKAKKPKSLFDQGKLKSKSLFDQGGPAEKSLFDQP